MTNGDKLRAGTDDDLVRAFAITRFDSKYIPTEDCDRNCPWPDFVCECCPETFRNWLKEARDE